MVQGEKGGEGGAHHETDHEKQRNDEEHCSADDRTCRAKHSRTSPLSTFRPYMLRVNLAIKR